MTYQQTATPRLYEVALDNGMTWRGTKRQFLLEHPDWYPYAVPVEQVTSDVLPDFQDDPHPKAPSSARRYSLPDIYGNTTYQAQPEVLNSPIRPRRSAQTATTPQNVPVARHRRRIHPLSLLGIGAVVALLLWIGAAWITNWWSGVQDDWQYTSRFRTFSVDKAVGHNGDSAAHPSHFIAQNDKRHILIIELPADDMTKAIIYGAPVLIGDGQDHLPVTLSFETDQQTGRLDMVLHVQDQQYVYANNGSKFVQPQV